MPFPSLTLSTDVRALTDRFLGTPIGEMITFSDMSKALEADILARRYLIQKAITVASREAGAIFSSIRGIGYKRLSAEDAPLLGSHARGRIRSTSRRTAGAIIRAISSANDVSEKARIDAFREVSALQLVQHVATERAAKAIPATDKPQPVAATLRAMMMNIGIAPPDKAA